MPKPISLSCWYEWLGVRPPSLMLTALHPVVWLAIVCSSYVLRGPSTREQSAPASV